MSKFLLALCGGLLLGAGLYFALGVVVITLDELSRRRRRRRRRRRDRINRIIARMGEVSSNEQDE